MTDVTRSASDELLSTVAMLPDQVLLEQTRMLARHEQALQLSVLDHLREIDARRLYLRLGYSSLFDYTINKTICIYCNSLSVTPIYRYCFRNLLAGIRSLIRRQRRRPDAAWWLAETRERLGAAVSGVRSWRHADNAMRDAFLRGLPPRPWTSPRLNPHPDPLVTAYAELLLDYDACVRAAYATSTYLHRRDLPSNGARHLSREIRIAIANIPRSAVAVANRLGSPSPEASS